MTAPASPGKSSGELKRFVWLVVVMVVVIVAGLAAFVYFSGEGGSLPFQYEGMN